MSKKRSKAQRKKQLKTKSRKPAANTAGGASDRPAGQQRVEAGWEADYTAPEVVDPLESGGGLGKMRSAMTRGEEGEGASLLRKRRGCGELTLWLLGGGAVFWAVMELIAFAYETGLEPSSPPGL